VRWKVRVAGKGRWVVLCEGHKRGAVGVGRWVGMAVRVRWKVRVAGAVLSEGRSWTLSVNSGRRTLDFGVESEGRWGVSGGCIFRWLRTGKMGRNEASPALVS
jgi:hypothetical protein